MADEIDELDHDANEREAEGAPEVLVFLQADRRGNNDNRRWRYAVRDVESLDYAGPGVWKQVGPAPVLVDNQQIFQGIGPDSGEVVDIAIDPRPGILYIATGSGGVWKSSDDGVSWRPLTDQLATSIGAIALDPGNPDIVYAGTGNLFDGGVGMPKSAGLFKSTDGGRTWARLGSPVGLPPRPITAAVNVAGGVRVTAAGHGYVTFDRVATVGLPGMVGAGGEGVVTRIDDNQLLIRGVTMTGAFGAVPATLYDARQPPFLSDRGVVRMVCPAPDTLLVATQTGLYLSRDGGRNFGANRPRFDDGRPIRNGLISTLEIDQGWMRVARVGGATPAAPIVVTVPRHGFRTGERVFVGGVESNRTANGGWLIDRIDDDKFSLRGSVGTGTGAAGGFVLGPSHPSTKPVQGATNPGAPQPIVITSAAHGFITGDIVAISGVQGNTAANRSWSIRVLTSDTFALVGSRGNGAHVANTGTIDGPAHRPPVAITAAVNGGGGITVTVPAHGLSTGDRVSVLGLPGVAAPNNSARIRRLDPGRFVLTGLALNAPYGGAGATMTGPADAYNTAYFVSAGRALGTNQLNPERGLFRLAITSTGDVVLSDNVLAHPGGVGGGGFGRVAFAQSLLPSTRTLYASVQDNEPTSFSTPVFVGLFRSDDFGATWVQRPQLAARANIDGGDQSDFDLTVGVDPQDSQRVYAALQQLWRSTDGGQTWPLVTPANRGGLDALTGIGRSPSTTLLHWDHHELVFPPPTRWAWSGADPVTPTPAYFGTDGGIARSAETGGVMSFTHLNEGIATSLLRHIDIGRGAGKNVATYGGMQDAGTAGHRQGDAAAAWTEGIDGDGGFVAVDPFDPNIVFGFDNDTLMRTTNGGRTWFLSDRPARPQIVSVHNENPVRVVTTGHTFRNGDFVTITGVPGGGGLANGNSQITVNGANQFRLNGKNGTAVPAFGTGPTATGDRFLAQSTIKDATRSAPIEIETTAPHGCTTGQRVRIDGVEGNVAANNSEATPTWRVTKISDTRLSLNGSDGSRSPANVQGTGRMLGPAVTGTVPIQRVENTNPVVVIAQGHGFMNGFFVTVAGVLGTTSANVTTVIRVLDANSFVLEHVAGNGAFVNGPRLVGPTIGRGVPNPAAFPPRCRVAIVPNPAAAATTIFVSVDAVLFRSDDGGIRFNQVNVFADPVTALHAPAPHRLWVGTAGRTANPVRPGRVLFSSDDGAHFNTVPNFVSNVGAQGAISAIAEDPNVAGGTRVAVVTSGYSETATTRRTRHCFLTTTGGTGPGAWTEVGGTFDAPTGNLPDIPVMGVGWDTTDADATHASVLLVASDCGVLRLGPGNVWQRVGPNLPNVSCQALAVDNTVKPPVIRVGTYGRSAWELSLPDRPSLHVEADLGFGDQLIGTTVRRRLVLHSVGKKAVEITEISGAGGDISLAPGPASIVLAPGARKAIDVMFKPSAAGDSGALLRVHSTDPERPVVEVKASGFGITAGRPRLSVRAFVEFGTVRTGAPARFPLEIRNIGTAPLPVTRLARDPASSLRFTLSRTVPPGPTPVIQPGDAFTVDVTLDVLGNGPLSGAVIVEGAGQGAVVSLSGTGTTSAAGMVATLFDVLGLGDRAEALV
jgi:photosystem II stability/assembly factor-like uncharacterized protein